MSTVTLAEARTHSRQWERAHSRTEAGCCVDIVGGAGGVETLYYTPARARAMTTMCRRLADRHGRTVHLYRWHEGGWWEPVATMHPPARRLTCHVRADARARRAERGA